jgi:hypothetical protein
MPGGRYDWKGALRWKNGWAAIASYDRITHGTLAFSLLIFGRKH